MKVSELMSRGAESCKLIDVRTPVEYSSERIEGAQLLPLNEFTEEKFHVACAACVSEVEDIVLICRSDKRAVSAMKKLSETTQKRVHILNGGMISWRELGGAIIEGKAKVISLERQVRIAAGLITVIGIILGFLVHPYWFLMAGGVGAGLVFAGVTDTCGMGLLLARMPWNQRKPSAQATEAPAKEDSDNSDCDSGG